jgi:uncharacterized membrane protein YcaP (DUF421 family)
MPGLPTLVTVFLHTVIIYAFLIVAVGRFGRPALSELSPFTYVSVALLGSAVESGLYAGGGSFTAGVLSAAVLLIANRLLAEGLQRWRRFRRVLVPVPVVLVRHGEPIMPSLKRMGLTMEQLRAAIRARGYDNLHDVPVALMEVNGDVGVVPYQDRAN